MVEHPNQTVQFFSGFQRKLQTNVILNIMSFLLILEIHFINDNFQLAEVLAQINFIFQMELTVKDSLPIPHSITFFGGRRSFDMVSGGWFQLHNFLHPTLLWYIHFSLLIIKNQVFYCKKICLVGNELKDMIT